MGLRDLGRRMFMRQAGLGAVAATMVNPRIEEARRHASMMASTTGMSGPAAVAGYSDPILHAARATARKVFSTHTREKAMRELMRDGAGLDPDIAALRSWSVAARLNAQRRRNLVALADNNKLLAAARGVAESDLEDLMW